MYNCSSCKFRYLRTPMGAVKLINVAIGTISLILVSISYVSVWALAVFVGTVSICLCLSIFHLIFCLLRSSHVGQSKFHRVASFLYHVLAGIALIVAGIELVGWSEYSDPDCNHDCSPLYTVGVAKTLTFMNGTLYLIVGFLGIKDDDLLDPEAADEDIPLLSGKAALASIPGSIAGSKHSFHNGQVHNFYYYDHFYRQPSLPYDIRSAASSYRNQFFRSPPQHVTAEYAFNDSYNSAYNGVQHNHHNYGAQEVRAPINNGNGKRPRKNSSPPSINWQIMTNSPNGVKE